MVLRLLLQAAGADEMLARKGQQLGVGRVIDRFHGLDLAGDGCHVGAQVFGKGGLFAGRSDHQDLLAVFQDLGDIVVEARVVVFAGMAVAVLDVRVRMRRVRFQRFGFGSVLVEMDDMGFDMVESDDGVIE